VGPSPGETDLQGGQEHALILGKASKLMVQKFHSYPGAGHAFMNRRGERYRADADRDSWPKTLAFFAKHLRGVTAAVR